MIKFSFTFSEFSFYITDLVIYF